MRQRTRKLLGTVLLVAWVAFYALLVVAIMHNAVRRFGPVGEPAFYAIAGIAWIPVAMLVIWWMAKPDPDDETA
jgi:hypothetical protein